VNRSALSVAAPGDQSRLLEHSDVLGHRLLGDLEGLGEVVDGRRTARQPRHDGPPDWVGQREKGTV
jgi:hypothetical protein